MLASLKWINEYVDIPYSTDAELQTFCDLLDLTGTGVEGKNRTGSEFEHVVVGQVISKEHHPDSDHMWVCMVDVGDKNVDDAGASVPLQIVCGAQNFEAGDKIVVAMIGAVLPGDFKIKKSKLRGVMSCGMNCSERELGLGNSHEGIMILPSNAPVGMPFDEYLERSDCVLDLEITPNRPDCMSIRGLAREFATIKQITWKDPLESDLAKLEVSNPSGYVEDEVSVEIEDGDRCPRYTACIIKGVKVGPSPEWLKTRLAALGQRSINNIVDVSNYILFLYGQPLHTFDLDWLKNGCDKAEIVVRAAGLNEELETLDGVKRKLSEDMTVISTKSAGAVALAGVMGGLNSEITDDTQNVLLETATFEAGRTSRTSRNLKLFSESSMRYERKVDDHDIDKRAAIAAALIKEVAGGEILCNKSGEFGLVDVWAKKSEILKLTFRINRFNEFIGEVIPTDFIKSTLTSLGCKVDGSGDVLDVVVPTFRPDLEREIDLYEEVLRIWGEDKITPTLPKSEKRVGQIQVQENVRRRVGRVLRACGMNETLSYSFVDPEINSIFANGDETSALSLINPLNAEQSEMRLSIISSLISSVPYNLKRGASSVSLFETGRVFESKQGKKLPKENLSVAGVMCGKRVSKSWNTEETDYDFFDAKGAVECICDEFKFKKVRFKVPDEGKYKFLFPGRIAEVFAGGTHIGWMGEIHPKTCQKLDINASVFAFELDLKQIQNASNMSKDYVEVSEFPSIEIDQNWVVDEDVTAEKMMQVITSAAGNLLTDLALIDIYRNSVTVGAGKKCMTYKLTYNSTEKTLTSDEVDKTHSRVVKKVCGAVGATERA